MSHADRTFVLGNILPASVSIWESFGSMPDAALLPEEEVLLERAVEKRRLEFAMGRTCARRALARLGFRTAPIMRGSNREPLWPEGIVGSITHCPGYCAAAVAGSSDLLAIGIDAEEHATIPDGSLDAVASEEEREHLGRLPSGIHWDRLLFSAKESVFKAWWPLHRKWLGFEDARIEFEPETHRFRAVLKDGREMCGRYLVARGFIMTAVALAPTRPIII